MTWWAKWDVVDFIGMNICEDLFPRVGKIRENKPVPKFSGTFLEYFVNDDIPALVGDIGQLRKRVSDTHIKNDI